MSYLDKYSKRMSSYGANVLEDYKESSVHLVNESFADIPSFRVVKINGVNVDSRIVQSGTQSNRQHILFRPGANFSKGELIEVDGGTWLLSDFFISEVFPKGRIEECQHVLKWKKGQDTHLQPCALSVDIMYLEEDKFVEVPDGTIIVRTPFNSIADTIVIRDRFIFGSSSFEVVVKDDFSEISKGKGVLKLTLKRVEISDNDDVENQISEPSTSLGSRWK